MESFSDWPVKNPTALRHAFEAMLGAWHPLMGPAVAMRWLVDAEVRFVRVIFESYGPLVLCSGEKLVLSRVRMLTQHIFWDAVRRTLLSASEALQTNIPAQAEAAAETRVKVRCLVEVLYNVENDQYIPPRIVCSQTRDLLGMKTPAALRAVSPPFVAEISEIDWLGNEMWSLEPLRGATEDNANAITQEIFFQTFPEVAN